jgi:hypothetical protein
MSWKKAGKPNCLFRQGLKPEINNCKEDFWDGITLVASCVPSFCTSPLAKAHALTLAFNLKADLPGW